MTRRKMPGLVTGLLSISYCYVPHYQSLPTVGGVDWEFVSIDGEHYLAVANVYVHSNSKLERIFRLLTFFQLFKKQVLKNSRFSLRNLSKIFIYE